MASTLCFSSQVFTPHGSAREFTWDIDELLNPAANLLQVPLDAGPTVA
jgi:hypothetical protein